MSERMDLATILRQHEENGIVDYPDSSVNVLVAEVRRLREQVARMSAGNLSMAERQDWRESFLHASEDSDTLHAQRDAVLALIEQYDGFVAENHPLAQVGSFLARGHEQAYGRAAEDLRRALGVTE